jgi:16S rRNA (cytidine1402-2'-O)-methyltransferase
MLRQPAARAARLWRRAAAGGAPPATRCCTRRAAGCAAVAAPLCWRGAAAAAAAATARRPLQAPRLLRAAACTPLRAASNRWHASTRALGGEDGGGGGEEEEEGGAFAESLAATTDEDALAGWVLPPGGDGVDPPLAPGLYVVSVPIGNLEDITLRALRVLRSADGVLAEDTRTTRFLLSRYGVRAPLLSFHVHNEGARQEGVLARLSAGAALALVSDAGTPAISDPGALLVAAAVAAGHNVVAVPGASALLAGLVVCGLPTHAVTFLGFLPAQPAARRRKLAAAAARDAGAGSGATLALYVPPHKLAATLADAATALGARRRCCVARELTKRHEEAWRGTLGDAAVEFARSGRARGEVTLFIEGDGGGGGGEGGEDDDADGVDAADAAADVETRLLALLATGMPPSGAAREVAGRTGVRRKEVYARAMELAKRTPAKKEAP